ncbi:MAG: hypothetical protein OQK24_01090 [Magnetovibrio sp.]|nr:hypothetical protein [Magnetovibrio sp.]
MLLEVRKLIFSDDLLKRALLGYFHEIDAEIPQSAIQKIRFVGTPGENALVIVEFMTADPQKPYEINLSEAEVLTAMISSCKEYRIPLPRNAAKTIQHTKQGLAMTVSMKVDTPPPAANQRVAS